MSGPFFFLQMTESWINAIRLLLWVHFLDENTGEDNFYDNIGMTNLLVDCLS
jgi:hypothetical protein